MAPQRAGCVPVNDETNSEALCRIAQRQMRFALPSISLSQPGINEFRKLLKSLP